MTLFAWLKETPCGIVDIRVLPNSAASVQKTTVYFAEQPAHAACSFPALKSVRKAVRECV